MLEEYVGIISCKEDDDPKIERLKEFRSLRKQHFDLVMKLDAIAKEIAGTWRLNLLCLTS